MEIVLKANATTFKKIVLKRGLLHKKSPLTKLKPKFLELKISIQYIRKIINVHIDFNSPQNKKQFPGMHNTKILITDINREKISINLNKIMLIIQRSNTKKKQYLKSFIDIKIDIKEC